VCKGAILMWLSASVREGVGRGCGPSGRDQLVSREDGRRNTIQPRLGRGARAFPKEIPMRFTVPALLVAAVMTAAAPAFAQTDAKPAEKPAPKQTEKASKLAVGDPAPALSIAQWIKGEPVTSFDKNKVYV